jgi:hypothetical protein
LATQQVPDPEEEWHHPCMSDMGASSFDTSLGEMYNAADYHPCSTWIQADRASRGEGPALRLGPVTLADGFIRPLQPPAPVAED